MRRATQTTASGFTLPAELVLKQPLWSIDHALGDPQTVEAAVQRVFARVPRRHLRIARLVLAALESELVA